MHGCEDSGLAVGLKPGELKMDSLRSDRWAVRSQNIFLNFAGRSQNVRSKKEKVRSEIEEVH
jgi:hypothetical protein